MAGAVRGGLPKCARLTVTTTGEGRRPPGVTQYVQVSNEGANVLRIYFQADDFTADANYIELVATTGYWEGPAEIGAPLPGSISGRDQIWFRTSGGDSDISVIWYLRH